MPSLINLQDILLTDTNREWLPQGVEAFVYLTAIFFIGLSLYHVTKLIFTDNISEYACDFVKTMTICAYSIGWLLVRLNFGDIYFILALVPLIILTVITIPGEATPITIWVQYFHNRIGLTSAVVKTVILMAAGLAAFWTGILFLKSKLQYVLFVFDYSTSLPSTCSSALKVPLYQGFVLEMLAVMYDSWFVVQKLSPYKLLDVAFKVTNTGLLVISGKTYHFIKVFLERRQHHLNREKVS